MDEEEQVQSEPQQFSPIAIRRRSMLDIGGASSLNNFASSVQRSVNYLSTSFDPSPIAAGLLQSAIDEDEEDIHPIRSRESIASLRSMGVRNNTNYGCIDEPVIKIVNPENNEVLIITNKSTSVQTIFNSINVLIGLGILSMPLALHLSGWVLGLLCITLSALATKQTAVLLGRILEKNPHLRTYQDIGIHCFGDKIGFVILIIFTLDLLGAGISMILLFADSFNALDPQLDKTSLKIAITSVLIVLNFFPLRLLSFLSLAGIVCTSITCLIIGLSGVLKTTSPGSLIMTMPTNLWPASPVDFFFALGLYMAPWGGHATFPEIYKDQLHPQKFNHCMKYSFSFSYLIDLLTGTLGFFMFGKLVDDEITKNILREDGYPKWIATVIVVIMGILPISKLPLISRPIVTIIDSNLGDSKPQKLFNRVLLSVIFLVASTLLTNFGKVMSLLGSLICFTVCLTLPALYYLAAFPDLPQKDKLLWKGVVGVGIFGACAGTIAVFLK